MALILVICLYDVADFLLSAINLEQKGKCSNCHKDKLAARKVKLIIIGVLLMLAVTIPAIPLFTTYGTYRSLILFVQ